MTCQIEIQTVLTLLEGVPAAFGVASSSICLWLAANSSKTSSGPRLAFPFSSSSGTGASLLGTGVSANLEVLPLKLGLAAGVFLGLDLSGNLTVVAEVGVLEKNDWIFFWPDEDPAFLRVAGVDDAGVADLRAILFINNK